MGARFLIRFDDICPTMNWATWGKIETIVDAYGLRPILAVVPENRDPHLAVGPARPDFWDCVRRWQSKGWSIGWHGYRHVYDSLDPGIVGVHLGSEFSGVPEDEQRARLEAAEAIFRRERVNPTVWIAPGHSFDWVTVKLLRDRGVTTISDGYFLRPVRMKDCAWVPQQLWRFRDMRIGLWTVCYHHNAWTEDDLSRFESNVERFHSKIVGLAEVLASPVPRLAWFDSLLASVYRRLVLVRTSTRRAMAE